MLIVLLALVGIVGIVIGGLAVRFVRNATSEDLMAGRLITLRWTAVAVGLVFGLVSWPLTFAMGYSYTTPREVGRVVGLPFMAAYFDAAGHDYVGPLTLPAVLANSIFWGLCPQIMLAGYVGARRHRSRPRSYPR
jgi:hypothetical protein